MIPKTGVLAMDAVVLTEEDVHPTPSSQGCRGAAEDVTRDLGGELFEQFGWLLVCLKVPNAASETGRGREGLRETRIRGQSRLRPCGRGSRDLRIGLKEGELLYVRTVGLLYARLGSVE